MVYRSEKTAHLVSLSIRNISKSHSFVVIDCTMIQQESENVGHFLVCRVERGATILL